VYLQVKVCVYFSRGIKTAFPLFTQILRLYLHYIFLLTYRLQHAFLKGNSNLLSCGVLVIISWFLSGLHHNREMKSHMWNSYFVQDMRILHCWNNGHHIRYFLQLNLVKLCEENAFYFHLRIILHVLRPHLILSYVCNLKGIYAYQMDLFCQETHIAAALLPVVLLGPRKWSTTYLVLVSSRTYKVNLLK